MGVSRALHEQSPSTRAGSRASTGSRTRSSASRTPEGRRTVPSSQRHRPAGDRLGRAADRADRRGDRQRVLRRDGRPPPQGADDGGQRPRRARGRRHRLGGNARGDRTIVRSPCRGSSSPRRRPFLDSRDGAISFAGDSVGARSRPDGGARRLRANGARARRARRSSPTARRGLHAAARPDRPVVRRAPVPRRADERLAARARAARAAPGPGRNVVAEYPIYDRAERICSPPRPHCSAQRWMRTGMGADEIHNMLVQYATPALIYTIPSFHNPTGGRCPCRGAGDCSSSSGGRAWCRSRACRSSRTTRTRSPASRARRAALFDLSGKRTVYISSFSTTIAPGLRVGWLVATGELADGWREDAAGLVHHALAAEPGDRVRVHHARQFRAPPRRAACRAQASPRRDARRARQAPAEAKWSPRRAAISSGWSCPTPDGRAVLERAQGVTGLAGTSFSAMSSWLRLSYAGRRRTRSKPGSSASPPRL